MPARHGIPDLAAIRFDRAAIARRLARGLRPLTSDTEVRAVLAMGRRETTVAKIAESISMTADYVRRAVVPLLVEQGWVHLDGRTLIRTPGAEFVGLRVVTVEAKLRDWHGALGQARTQMRSADDAYVAFDTSTVTRLGVDVDKIAASGIGVIAVDPITQHSVVVARPQRRLPRGRTLIGRTLIAERCMEMLVRNERARQIYPVFGWTLPRA